MGQRRPKGKAITGWINFNKPVDMTSAHAVAIIKRLTDAQKVGHGGTLDPLATGVLPIALGEATKLVPYLMDRPKTYAFTVSWGEERDTDDREGQVIKNSEKRPLGEDIDAILPQFIGTVDQVPPIFSAIKIDGERAYDLARAGKDVEIPARPVDIFSFDRIDPVSGPQDETRFVVHCGKGTYVRSLARDLGRKLGCYGHISALSRTQVGGLTLESAISLEELKELSHKAAPQMRYLRSMAAALDDIPALAVTMDEAKRIRSGQSIMHMGVPDGLLSLTFHGDVIAMAECETGQINPVRVFNIKIKE